MSKADEDIGTDQATAVEERDSGPTERAAARQDQPGNRPGDQRGGIAVDDSKAVASYANFCRVTGTPEELIVDFGLNKQVGPATDEPIEIAQRLIVNFFTAKRLLAALHMAVQRHEAAFGVLETDVQKRVLPRVGGR